LPLRSTPSNSTNAPRGCGGALALVGPPTICAPVAVCRNRLCAASVSARPPLLVRRVTPPPLTRQQQQRVKEAMAASGGDGDVDGAAPVARAAEAAATTARCAMIVGSKAIGFVVMVDCNVT
jgi:hypothetical protein